MTESTKPERYYDVEEMAEVLHLRPQTILAWKRKGKLPGSVKVGRKLLWPSEQVERLLAKLVR
jgi:excisionase family DNA binding protein